MRKAKYTKTLTGTERFDLDSGCHSRWLKDLHAQIQRYEPITLPDHIPCDRPLQLTAMEGCSGAWDLTEYQSKLTWHILIWFTWNKMYRRWKVKQIHLWAKRSGFFVAVSLGFFNPKLKISKENLLLTKPMYKIFFPQAETIWQEYLLKAEQIF